MAKLHQPRRNRGLLALAFSFIILLVAATTYTVTRPESDPFQGNAIVDPPFASLTYGVQGFMWWYDVDLTLEWVRLLSFTHVKQVFPWKDMEPEPGQWIFDNADRIVNGVETKGLHLIVRLSDAPDWAHPSLPPQQGSDYIDAPADDPADWANYCGTVAQRYKGRITAYQIWNEPNLTREWGNREPDAAQYVALLQACGAAIRAADPNAILISAGLSPTGTHDENAHRDDIYLQAMYDAGFQQYIDAVGAHAPGFGPPDYGPDDAVADGGARWASFRRIEDLRKIMIKNGDAARQMAILETGYTTDTVNPVYSWFAVTEEDQAKYMVEAYEYAVEHWRPWVGLMSAIYIAKPIWTEDDEQFWWSLNDPQTGRMRPVFGALAQMEKHCDDIVVPQRGVRESAFALEHNPCN